MQSTAVLITGASSGIGASLARSLAGPCRTLARGWRPGEVSAEVAAQWILRSVERNRALSGFPLGLYWLARASLLSSQILSDFASQVFRFHLAEARR